MLGRLLDSGPPRRRSLSRARFSPARRSIPLLLALFVAGAGVGALLIALSGHSSTTRVVVKRIVTSPQSRAHHAPRTSPSPATNALPAADPTTGSLISPAARSSFSTLSSQLGGSIGLAVAPLGDGQVETLGTLQTARAWSTMKVPVIATLLHNYETSNKILSPGGHDYARRAIEESDNAAAEALFGELERIGGGLSGASAAVEQTLRTAGDTTTTINTSPNTQGFTTWGQSLWSARGEVLFFQALARGCLLVPDNTSLILDLMRNVTPSQRWGAGAAGYPPAASVAFKAGWGPESGGYLVRQTAIIGSGNHGYVVSYLARPVGGSFDQGVRVITALASWARQHLDMNVRRPTATCTTQP